MSVESELRALQSTVLSINNNVRYLIANNNNGANAANATSSSGIGADFFCDLFDRTDTGEFKGNFTGDTNNLVIANEMLKAIGSTTITSSASVSSSDYVIQLDCIPVIPEADSNGYINSGALQYYKIVFGGGRFSVAVSFNTDNNTASLQAIASAYKTRNDAIASADKTRSDTIASATDGWASNIDGFRWFEPLRGGDHMEIIAYYDVTLAIRYVGGDIVKIIDNGHFVTGENPYHEAWIPVVVYANDAYTQAVTAAKDAYTQAVIAAGEANTQAVANLPQGLLGSLSISLYNDVVTLSKLAPKLHYTMLSETASEVQLKITVSGNTITATGNDASISYSDASVIKPCKQIGLTINSTSPVASIKAYRSDISEPTESGYGKAYTTRQADIEAANQKADDALSKLTGGVNDEKLRNDIETARNKAINKANLMPEILYQDKYHTPIKDADGNLTGYTYNPNAA